MAGGGIRGGVHYGSTDDIGYKAGENPVSVHDIHATILHRTCRRLSIRAQRPTVLDRS